MRIAIALLSSLILTGGCASDADDGATLDKAHASTLGGKEDGTGRDLCAVYEWYGDGECDVFCDSPDPDCGPVEPDTPIETTRFNASCELASWYDLDTFTVLEAVVIDAVSDADSVIEAQIVANDQDSDTLADAIANNDDQEFLLYKLGQVDASGGAIVLHLYVYYLGDTQVGFYMPAGDVAAAGWINDGSLDATCVGGLTTDAATAGSPWEMQCHWGGDEYLNLLTAAIGPPSTLKRQDVTADQIAYLEAGAERVVFEASVDTLFDNDDGVVYVQEVVPYDSDAATHLLYTLYAGDTHVGFVVNLENSRVVADMQDGEISGDECFLEFRPNR